MEMNPSIVSFATASPAFLISQEDGKSFLENHFRESLSPGSLRVLQKVFSHPSIKRRRFAFEGPEAILNTDPDVRIARFTRGALALGKEAIEKAIRAAEVPVEKVTALIVNTCTGYICPGLSTYLIESLGLNRTIQAYDLVGSGCGGAIPNLQLAQGLLRDSADAVVVCLSVEICSSTFQMGNDLSLIVSNGIFADGAAAAVLWNKPQGLELLGSRSRFAPEYREHIRFVHKGGQLHNQLSPQLPTLTAQTAHTTIRELLGSFGLETGDVHHWAMHPGGSKVIDAVRDETGIREDKLVHSRRVLENFGNLSSPTVWFVLDEIRKQGIHSGDYVVLLAFGAGLSAHASLLRQR